jgi:transcriptional regulator with PAS, ATPase and Fis domain
MLAKYFTHKHARRSGKSIDALETGVIASLQAYHWPGNVRELENTIERAIVLTTGSTITRDTITVDATLGVRNPIVPSLKLQQNVEWIECATIRRALDIATDKKQAARLMGISPRALSYYLGKYPFLDQKRVHRRPSSNDVVASLSEELATAGRTSDDQVRVYSARTHA